ncbi:MAG: ATP-binding protein [Planctomycetota bacterium]
MRRPSIQRRVLLWAVLAVAATIGVTGLAVHRTMEARLRSTGAEAIRSVLEVGATRVIADSIMATRRGGTELGDLGDATRTGYVWACRRAPQEQLLASSPEFPTIELDVEDASVPGLGAGDWTESIVWETVDADGRSYRAARVVIEPARGPGPPGDGRGPPGGGRGPRGGGRGPGPGPGPGLGGADEDDGFRPPPRRPDGQRRPEPPFRPGEQFVVVTAIPIQAEVEALDALARLLGVAGAGSALVAALLIGIVVRRGLAPLDALSNRIAAIRETDLDETIRLENAPAELVPIVESFDSTRKRLAGAFGREKRFTADAAHELRTPVAGMRATLEVLLRRDRSVAAHREAAEQCLEIVLSMQETIDGLLLLARSGATDAERQPVEVQPALRRAFAEHAAAIEAERLSVRYGASAVATVVPMLFDRITANLASNATSYARPGTTISVDARETPDEVRLTVTNECEAVPAETAERAFEPFWRADAARTDTIAHAGLGLALVRTCAEAMGGSASIDAADTSFAVTVALPR